MDLVRVKSTELSPIFSIFRSFEFIRFHTVYEIFFNFPLNSVISILQLKLNDCWINLKFELSRIFICKFVFISNRVFESQLYILYAKFFVSFTLFNDSEIPP